jgi:hypothetical protein
MSSSLELGRVNRLAVYIGLTMHDGTALLFLPCSNTVSIGERMALAKIRVATNFEFSNSRLNFYFVKRRIYYFERDSRF